MTPDAGRIGISLLAGFLSFVSPCFLPILPGFLSFVAGSSVQEMSRHARGWTGALVRKVLVLEAGFTLAFITMGASATAVGSAVRDHLPTLRVVAGSAILILGLHLTGLIRIPFLLRERRIQVGADHSGYAKAFLVGVFFAFGWSPCIGPLLAPVLALAATEATVYLGMFLMFVFSVGLGAPILLSAVFFESFLRLFARAKKYLRAVEVAAGVFLAAFGLLVLTDQFSRLSVYLTSFNRFEEWVVERLGEQETAVPAAPAASADADAGEPRFPPHTRFDGLQGDRVTLGEIQGRITLLNFFAAWCGPCRLETPGFVTLHERYAADGFQVVAIAEDSPTAQIFKFADEFSIQYPVVLDPEGKIGDQAGVIGLPTSYLIDADGRVLRSWSGYVKEADLEEEIRKRLGN